MPTRDESAAGGARLLPTAEINADEQPSANARIDGRPVRGKPLAALRSIAALARDVASNGRRASLYGVLVLGRRG